MVSIIIAIASTITAVAACDCARTLRRTSRKQYTRSFSQTWDRWRNPEDYR